MRKRMKEKMSFNDWVIVLDNNAVLVQSNSEPCYKHSKARRTQTIRCLLSTISPWWHTAWSQQWL